MSVHISKLHLRPLFINVASPSKPIRQSQSSRNYRCNLALYSSTRMTPTFIGHQSLSTDRSCGNYPHLTSRCSKIQRFSSSATKDEMEQLKHSILSHALKHVHDLGWTDDAIVSGTLDAGFPPSYMGHVSSTTTLLGSADLVIFFMKNCNSDLKTQLWQLRQQEKEDKITNAADNCDSVGLSSRVYKALQLRLSMVLPFVVSHRWHEGMAIGALPQNLYHTTQQLDEMAQIVLEFAQNQDIAKRNVVSEPIQKAAIVTAYAAAEFHLISDEMNSNRASSCSSSYTGEQYDSTWNFLKERCDDATRVISNETSFSPVNIIPINPAHIPVASALVSSLVGAMFSVAAPSAAATLGYTLPRIMSTLHPLQDVISKNTRVGNGASANDYE